MIQNVILSYDNNDLEEKSDLENEDDYDNNDLEESEDDLIRRMKDSDQKIDKRKKVIG